MTTEIQKPDLEEIRNILDIRIGHFHDKITKWIFRNIEILRGLVLIVAGDLVEHLDFERTEIESTGVVDNTLRELVSDMVFTVPFRDTSKGDALTIYILLEHQSTVDRMMGYRLLSYMCHIWYRQLEKLREENVTQSQQRLRPILPIVFYTGSRRWVSPLSLNAVMDVPEQLARFVPTFDTLFFDVKDMQTDELMQTDHPFAWLMTVLQKEEDDADSMRQAFETALKRLDPLESENPVLHQNLLIYLYLLVIGRRQEDEHPDLLQLLRVHTQNKEVENIIMSGAEAIMLRGIEQGIEQGRINEKRTVVLKLLRHRFENVTDSVVDEITEIDDLVRLDELFDQALAAESFEDIDLSNNGE